MVKISVGDIISGLLEDLKGKQDFIFCSFRTYEYLPVFINTYPRSLSYMLTHQMCEHFLTGEIGVGGIPEMYDLY